MAIRERYPVDPGQWTTMKAEIRNSIWQLLTQQGAIRFPQASGRIPNFVGAGQAARQLRELTVWRRAQIIKVNPDAPQLLQPSIRNSLSPTRFPCSPMIFQSIFSSPLMK